MCNVRPFNGSCEGFRKVFCSLVSYSASSRVLAKRLCVRQYSLCDAAARLDGHAQDLRVRVSRALQSPFYCYGALVADARNSIVTVLGLVGGAPAQGWGGDTARRRFIGGGRGPLLS